MLKSKTETVEGYHAELSPEDRRICETLRKEIDFVLKKAESRIWHGHPVWFLDGNPIVGYHKLKDSVRVLFWSGQGFQEEGLAPEGKFKAAEIRYREEGDVQVTKLRKWLRESKTVQWDYKNIVKRKGKLELLE